MTTHYLASGVRHEQWFDRQEARVYKHLQQRPWLLRASRQRLYGVRRRCVHRCPLWMLGSQAPMHKYVLLMQRIGTWHNVDA